MNKQEFNRVAAELLPCPFCGGKAKISEKESYGYYDYSFVECVNPKCLIKPTTGQFNNIRWSKEEGNVSIRDQARADAAKAWNTRTNPDEPVQKNT